SRRVDDLWTAAIVNPTNLSRRADEFAAETRKEADEAPQLAELVSATPSAYPPVSADRLAAIVDAAASARNALGHPVKDQLDVLTEMPEIAPGEPCPVLRIADSATGWLSIWQVTPDGAQQSAVAIFQ